MAQLTAAISPTVPIMAFLDWAVHLVTSPGKQARLLEKGYRKAARLAQYVPQCVIDPEAEPCITPLAQDHRFADKSWQKPPYNLIYQSFLLTQQWWANATVGVPGVDKKHQAMMDFGIRQWLDIFSPSNFFPTNPEIQQLTWDQQGDNLVNGFKNWLEDWTTYMQGARPTEAEAYKVGQNLAVTPGKVVYRNHLIELIQYAPTTAQVHTEPVLIVPAWIMKFYILDLSPHNSLVNYLVSQGHSVFMISWRNPDKADRDISLKDYRQLGVMAALEVMDQILPGRPVHGVGYCIGGTLLSIAAAAMARESKNRLCSVTLLAAQCDFSEAGELMLFINEAQVSYLEDLMWQQGYLDNSQMSGVFQLLHSNDLIWSRMIRDYLRGTRSQVSELTVWNSDQTRMPYRMHSEYLRGLLLNNDLAEGRYEVDGTPISIDDIRVPVFVVGTRSDHIAPWRSVYKVHRLFDASLVTFVLTSGGHNAGIVSEPGHPNRHFQISSLAEGQNYVDPETWEKRTPTQDGSWWPAWHNWLKEQSSGLESPPTMGARKAGLPPLEDAPGSYVLQK
jgi:polyhydroxyalkanoate synthase